MAAKRAGSKVIKFVFDGPVTVVKSITDFGFASKTGFVSARARSSGEQEISLSSRGVATRGRVCATAEVNQRLTAKHATRIRANGFRITINEELPFPLSISATFYFLREEGTAKRPAYSSGRSRVVQAAM
jgi:hypothetical protein